MFAGFAALIYLPDRTGVYHHPSTTLRLWWFGDVGAFWLASCIYMVNRCYGRTKLSTDGMQLRSIFTRRFIAWGETTQIEKCQHYTRGGSWWEIRIHITGGRKRHLPGAFTLNSSSKSMHHLNEDLEAIRSYWKNADSQSGLPR
ncbi:MAG: hypothetical protein J2P28_03035 [Actinobacteria bacterium]|nr:hypothetical protein [Actinomycetota bacterium]